MSFTVFLSRNFRFGLNLARRMLLLPWTQPIDPEFTFWRSSAVEYTPGCLQPGPFGAFSLSAMVRHHPSFVAEPHYRPAARLQVGHDESYTRKQFAKSDVPPW